MILVLKRYLDALQSSLMETVLLVPTKYVLIDKYEISFYASLFINCLNTGSLAEVSVVCLI